MKRKHSPKLLARLPKRPRPGSLVRDPGIRDQRQEADHSNDATIFQNESRVDPVIAQTSRGSTDDIREALFNGGSIGPANQIQVSGDRIIRLSAIVVDLDPDRLRADNPYFPTSSDPETFYRGIRPVLERHPLARSAEIRSSGRGLHVIVRIDPPIELRSAEEQERWGAIAQAVQLSLPSDPNAPGITALTRPIGSINSKNGAEIKLLHEGEPVSAQAVADFVSNLTNNTFKTLANILLGTGRISPCPLCLADGSSLAVLDRFGQCYGCGGVSVANLADLVLAPDPLPGRRHQTRIDGKAGRGTRRGARTIPARVPQGGFGRREEDV